MPESTQTQVMVKTEFTFDDHVFTVDATNSSEPLFVFNEVCEYLGFKSPRRAADKIPERDISYAMVTTTSGDQRVRMINEPGLYRLVFSSKLPKAEAFKDLIFREILPSIRKTGEYQTKARRLQVTQSQFDVYLKALSKAALGGSKEPAEIRLALSLARDFGESTGIKQTNVISDLEILATLAVERRLTDLKDAQVAKFMKGA